MEKKGEKYRIIQEKRTYRQEFIDREESNMAGRGPQAISSNVPTTELCPPTKQTLRNLTNRNS